MDGVRGQQHMYVDGRRADLLLRFTHDCEKGAADDWLVVENKTTAVGIGALDQLALSVDWLRAEARPGDVHGMLIADGLSLEVERGLRERSFDYLSMTQLGYRRWVRLHSPLQPEPQRDATSINYARTSRRAPSRQRCADRASRFSYSLPRSSDDRGRRLLPAVRTRPARERPGLIRSRHRSWSSQWGAWMRISTSGSWYVACTGGSGPSANRRWTPSASSSHPDTGCRQWHRRRRPPGRARWRPARPARRARPG